jgi:purine-cytosine permease-like protein
MLAQNFLLSDYAPVTRPRRSLFFKYFVTLFVAVVVPLILGAVSDAWFGYRDQRLLLNEVIQV